jgi:Uma2 family endonuclease
MEAVRPDYLTEEEFLRRPPSRYGEELLDGELIVSPAPTTVHQVVLGRLHLSLHLWAREAVPVHTVLMSPCDVVFGRDRILEPDLFVMGRYLGRDAPSPLREIPRLVVEIISSRPRYDRHTKRLVYGMAGVPEYWCVHPAGGIERWVGPGLTERSWHEQTLECEALPGLVLDVAELFRL